MSEVVLFQFDWIGTIGAVLDMAKMDPAGRDYPPAAYVFGELGFQILNIKKGWKTAVLRAHGQEPAWVRGPLAPASRRHLQTINLHFHDLRHEAGSRWLEAGWPLHKVRDMLGHATIDQTDTYLNASRLGLQEEMRRFDGTRCNPVANEPGSGLPADRNEAVGDQKQPTIN